MNNFKRVLALMLCLCMSFAFAACGGKDTAADQNNNQKIGRASCRERV